MSDFACKTAGYPNRDAAHFAKSAAEVSCFNRNYVGDSPSNTLSRFSWPNNCRAIICGGIDDGQSNCLGDDVMDAAKDFGIDLIGVSPKSGCGVYGNGDWYQFGN